jgi:hypothetical protein
MKREYKDFKDFYPFYLEEHSNRTCRALHFAGTWLVVGIVVWTIYSGNPWLLLWAPVAGYGFAWVGHFFFGKNRPATFSYPLYSFMGDWVMWKDIMAGKVRL